MQPDRKIRVLVTDDSIVARNMIINGISIHPRIEVIGYAINPFDAKQKIAQLKPDVMTCDVEMPGMSGIEFLKQLIPTNPLPVILVSTLNLRVFDALEAGAVDFVRKPDDQTSVNSFIATLTQKIIMASTARVRTMPKAPMAVGGSASGANHIPLLGSNPVLNQTIIALGASTGGTEATLEVLKRLPADIPGMVITQHMPTGFTKMYAERLDKMCDMEVREAKNGDEIRRGLALLAPADLQMRVVRLGTKYTVSCAPGEKVSGHRPSVDALFHSMADVVQCRMVGIIMTGMGRDGAAGLLKMRQKGAYTIGQDEESSVVYGMPAVAYKMGAVKIQASCSNISDVLIRHLKTMH